MEEEEQWYNVILSFAEEARRAEALPLWFWHIFTLDFISGAELFTVTLESDLSWESRQMDLFHLKQKSYQEFPRMLQENPSLERPQCFYQLLISIHFNKKRSKHIGSCSDILTEQPRCSRATGKSRSSCCIFFFQRQPHWKTFKQICKNKQTNLKLN